MNEEQSKEYELDVGPEEGGGKDELTEALRQLEESTPARRPSQKTQEAEASEPSAPASASASEPSADEPAQVLDRARIQAQEARTGLQDFVQAHPYLIAPNVTHMMDDCLKEIVVTMTRVQERQASKEL